MTSLRILQLDSMLSGGGTDDQIVKLTQGLHQAGHPVWVAGPDGREFSNIIRDMGLPFHLTPPEGPAKARFVLAVARFIRREKIQIVHGHHGRDYWPTILAARLSGANPKIVLTRHLAKSPGSWASRRFLLRQCDALIAVSEFVAKVLREGAYEPDSPEAERRARPPIRGDHRKIHVIYGGIDTAKFKPANADEKRREFGLSPENFAFAVVGGFDPPRGKGQREFLAAAASIHQKIPQARFLIIGRGGLAAILESDIARLGLTGKAWLTGQVSDMPKAMNAIDCLVHPQIGTEAFPGVVLEALACGRPIIASALDGIPEAYQAGGYGRLVTPEDIGQLAAALCDWMAQPRKSEAERIELHRRVAGRFSVAAATRRVLEVYQTLCPAPTI
ncbi:MAG: glycosyltransferase [Verrucomicrobiota bacterium]|jgi:glycosyltransferase involved in cell wall biosynthesis